MKLAQTVRILSLPDHDRVDVSAHRHVDVVRLRVEFVLEAGDARQAIIAGLDMAAAERLHSQLGRALGMSR